MKTTPIVDAVGRMNFKGNIIPHTWYKAITLGSGKPDLVAITILSDIVWWYRPQEIRDEGSGELLGFKRKFHGDKLQRSYGQLSEMFGITKRQAAAACKRLQVQGIVTLHFRTVSLSNGRRANNVLFIEPVPARLQEITYPITSERNSLSRSNVIASHVQTEEPITFERETNTEITTETTTEKTILPAGAGEKAEPSSCTAFRTSPEPLPETPQERMARLRDQTGGDYLGLTAHCEEKQAEAGGGGWTVSGIDCVVFGGRPLDVFCRLTGTPRESLSPKKQGQYAAQLAKIAAEWAGEDGLPMVDAAGLARCIDALGVGEFSFKSYSSPYQRSFGDDLGVIIARHIAGRPLVEERKGRKNGRGRRGSRGSDWPGQGEQQSVWDIHGDWAIGFFQIKRRAVEAEFGSDRYLNTALYKPQVVQLRGISEAEADALIVAYDRWWSLQLEPEVVG